MKPANNTNARSAKVIETAMPKKLDEDLPLRERLMKKGAA
jgi:hypothetical protein